MVKTLLRRVPPKPVYSFLQIYSFIADWANKAWADDDSDEDSDDEIEIGVSKPSVIVPKKPV